jgi:hypothetical protein
MQKVQYILTPETVIKLRMTELAEAAYGALLNSGAADSSSMDVSLLFLRRSFSDVDIDHFRPTLLTSDS